MITRKLSPRATGGHSKTNPALIAVSVSIGCLFLFIAIYVYVRKKRLQNPKYIPSSGSSNKSRWRVLQSSPIRLRRLFTPSSPLPSSSNRDEETSYAPSTRTATTEPNEMESANNVNRNTSIRSIMTLPAYHPSPNPNERLIAREGERAGVDTVIEFPETAEEEETRREEDMEALYRIRQTRRQEIAERNERRRQRQEAREQGDWARLEQLRLDAQRRARARADSAGSAASSTTSLPQTGTSRELIAEHAARTSSRDTRVSSVSYAELGLARHDGSRLRADSVESDHRPLLDSAAHISGNNITNNNNNRHNHHNSIDSAARHAPRRTSRFHLPVFGGRQHRAASASSVATTTDSEIAEMTPQTSSAERSGSDPAVRTPTSSGASGEPSPPTYEPPRYDDYEVAPAPGVSYGTAEPPPPPDYTSPVRDRGEGIPRLPTVRVNASLPAIEIIGSTPVVENGDDGEDGDNNNDDDGCSSLSLSELR